MRQDSLTCLMYFRFDGLDNGWVQEYFIEFLGARSALRSGTDFASALLAVRLSELLPLWL